ncbi:glycoside hydrolase family 32 protein [Anaerocolumna sp. AGMB13020]|uniref:glycoside hydrolase family 32 protein n=1 Tax=Anaerocolumna sp. AGMB13020 TaxID=3081750 RepID=UPI002952B0F3|nr:glycoside hydrolase family 32 protein [Anaerocolumna sp. AGMB13020]WOO39042.1 glycoside hydrolase family 32 protein [Anaerocolumna sp. AGMB13020]
MNKIIHCSKEYLYLPVQRQREEKCLEIFSVEEDSREIKIMEFMIPQEMEEKEESAIDYSVRLPVKQFTGKTLLLKGDFKESFAEGIFNDTFLSAASLRRPSIHFTAERGWINDPNGLIFHNGIYHLYYQYNPCNTEWNNMCWGHAISRDLLFWEHQDLVLMPDSEGMMFSGSAISNGRGMLGLPEDAILYFYTAAGGVTKWSKEKPFTQKLAYSLDGGYTLTKTEAGKLNTIAKENRDPKVFWHEESGAYIMSLWLEGNEFALLRSKELLNWELTDRLNFEGAWECPDLFQVKDEEGHKLWVFWCADGYYYLGTFDGYHFTSEGIRHHAYINTLPYAAQTFSGISDRVVSVSWLRTTARKELYTGAMGVPRELKLFWNQGQPVLAQPLVRELSACVKEVDGDLIKKGLPEEYHYQWEAAQAVLVEMLLGCNGEAVTEWMIGKDRISYDKDSGLLMVMGVEYAIGAGLKDFTFLLDDVIFEVTANHDIILGIFELTEPVTSISAKPEQFKEYRVYQLEG